MAENKLTEFYNTVPGSNFKLKDIDCIFDAKGDLRELHDVDVIVNSINNILNIPKGSYICDPNFGVGLEKYIFEPTDEVTKQAIIHEVRNAISVYEQRAKIDINVYYYNNMSGFQISIKIEMDGNLRDLKVNFVDNKIKNI